MSVNINTFKNFVEFISNKTQQGATVSPSQFNLLCNRAQMQLFEHDRALFLQTGVSTNFLEFFFKNQTVSVPSTGVLPYPSDFFQTGAIRSYYIPPSTGVGLEVPVENVKDTNWGAVISSQLVTPTKQFPKYSEFRLEYRFAPKNIGIVMIDYFNKPVEPVWGFTVVSGRPVYDPATSTDFEWDDYSTNAVAALYLQLIGVNLKDTELAGFAQMYKQETNSPV